MPTAAATTHAAGAAGTADTAAGGRSRQRPRGAARRTALLEATLAVVAERGIDAVTHRAVAARADLPLASTTYWFDSKDALLAEALRHAADRDTGRLRAAAERVLAARSDARAAIAAERIVEVLFSDGEGDTAGDPVGDRGDVLAAYSLLLEAARRPALRPIAADWTRAYLETLGALLARAGSARPADDARLLMAALDGLQFDRLAGSSPADPADPGDSAPDLVIDDADLRSEFARLLDALLKAGA